MGLDIHISTDNDKEVYAIEFFKNEKDFRYKMSLSREFCNLMCRQYATSGIPEFNQISNITEVDISPILDMEKYWDEQSAEHKISFAETEEEKIEITKKIQADRDSLQGNIDRVDACITTLLDKLSAFDDMHKKLIVYGNDTIGINYYFSDFNNDKGDGYIGNNFGQDLRNFKRFLAYASLKGASTVYFNYG
jgi:hypothetical protein